METAGITKQMVSFQKIAFENWYNAMSIMQDQAESTVSMVLNQSNWIPAEGRQSVQGWIDICQQERNRFKAYVEQGFADLEKAVAIGKKTAASKTKES